MARNRPIAQILGIDLRSNPGEVRIDVQVNNAEVAAIIDQARLPPPREIPGGSRGRLTIEGDRAGGRPQTKMSGGQWVQVLNGTRAVEYVGAPEAKLCKIQVFRLAKISPNPPDVEPFGVEENDLLVAELCGRAWITTRASRNSCRHDGLNDPGQAVTNCQCNRCERYRRGEGPDNPGAMPRFEDSIFEPFTGLRGGEALPNCRCAIVPLEVEREPEEPSPLDRIMSEAVERHARAFDAEMLERIALVLIRGTATDHWERVWPPCSYAIPGSRLIPIYRPGFPCPVPGCPHGVPEGDTISVVWNGGRERYDYDRRRWEDGAGREFYFWQRPACRENMPQCFHDDPALFFTHNRSELAEHVPGMPCPLRGCSAGYRGRQAVEYDPEIQNSRYVLRRRWRRRLFYPRGAPENGHPGVWLWVSEGRT